MKTRPICRYHIRIQRRCEYNGLYARDDWRAYREWLVWPKTFGTRVAAEEFMRECFTFKGLQGSKLSASVCECSPTPTKWDYGRPGVSRLARHTSPVTTRSRTW